MRDSDYRRQVASYDGVVSIDQTGPAARFGNNSGQSGKSEAGNRKQEVGGGETDMCVCVCVCVCVCTISLTENHFGGDVLGGAEDLLVGELARLAVDESFV